MHVTKCLAIAIFSIVCTPLAALEQSLVDHPDPATAKYYQQNTSKIDALREIVRNDPSSDVRLKNLETLEVDFPDAAFNTATDLISDPVDAVALKVVEFISRSIVMSDHKMSDSDFSPRLNYVMDKHMRGRVALRAVLSDKRKAVRNAAALALAGLSDKEALEIIAREAADGLYSETEAVNLFALANPDIGGAYIEPYLAATSEKTQAAAVSYLGAYPAYQARIRDDIFRNPKKSDMLRAQAARTLKTYDSKFESYALAVTSDPNIAPQLYAETIKGYVDNVQSKGKTIEPETARILAQGMNSFISEHQSTLTANQSLSEELRALEARLQSLSPRL